LLWNQYKEDGTPIVYPVLDPQTGKPTGKTTSSAEWVFVYDVTASSPKLLQKINIPITYVGLVWNPAGTGFYVSGGLNDIVYSFKLSGGSFVPDAPFFVLNTGVLLDSTPAGAKIDSFKLTSYPVVAGIEVSADGSKLYVGSANYCQRPYGESIS
jgi:hypothetical protein